MNARVDHLLDEVLGLPAEERSAVAAALMFLPRLVRQFKAGLMITPEMLRALQAEGGIAVIDVRDFLEVKWRALQAHRTEFARSRTLRAIRALDEPTRAALLGWECYVRRDLVDGGRALFG